VARVKLVQSDDDVRTNETHETARMSPTHAVLLSCDSQNHSFSSAKWTYGRMNHDKELVEEAEEDQELGPAVEAALELGPSAVAALELR